MSPDCQTSPGNGTNTDLIGPLPVILGMLVLGAHFYRAGHLLFAGGALLSLGLLFIRQPVMIRVMQGLLVAGAVEWLVTEKSGSSCSGRPKGFHGSVSRPSSAWSPSTPCALRPGLYNKQAQDPVQSPQKTQAKNYATTIPVARSRILSLDKD